MDVIDRNMIAAVAQVLGFGGIIWGLAQNWRTLQTQVALEFYRRFAEITDRMPVELRLASSGGPHWATIQDPLRGQMLVSMLSYLNLSAEEFALYEKGRLPKDVWQGHDTGDRGQLRQAAVAVDLAGCQSGLRLPARLRGDDRGDRQAQPGAACVVADPGQRLGRQRALSARTRANLRLPAPACPSGHQSGHKSGHSAVVIADNNML